jgi:hypothetical protein
MQLILHNNLFLLDHPEDGGSKLLLNTGKNYQWTRRHIPEDCNLQYQYYCELER